ncbi:hypothetical protein Gohar_027321 [Gossypium harknessii]|uniref:Uncharacterized protein n=1 Tax=Gossypium harknessii TaxID=34285 RepID=A0A7J9HX46_9ROSI|nr:hypothetical protein [Gossypium harknessii]
MDGLKLISDRRVKKVLIQMDNHEAATTIQDDSAGISSSALVRRIHQTMLTAWMAGPLVINRMMSTGVPFSTNHLGISPFIEPPSIRQVAFSGNAPISNCDH